MLRTRFAPSPTGLLHLGNAYSALRCAGWAEHHHASLFLRIEDIDHTRCRVPYIQAIREDLAWLGINWHNEVPLQSERLPVYAAMMNRLQQLELVYPCFCTRADFVRQEQAGEDQESCWHCPGECARRSMRERAARMPHEAYAMRLDCAAAWSLLGTDLVWHDHQQQAHRVHELLNYDPVIGRKDIRYSYHLCVVVDDAEQGTTHIIRGMDLLESTAVHRLLQALLDLPSPLYLHHPLLLDAQGQRLAKRVASTAIRDMREQGVSAAELRQQLLQDSVC